LLFVFIVEPSGRVL